MTLYHLTFLVYLFPVPINRFAQFALLAYTHVATAEMHQRLLQLKAISTSVPDLLPGKMVASALEMFPKLTCYSSKL